MLLFLKYFWFVTLANFIEALLMKWRILLPVTATDIVTEYGAYYEKNKQNKNRILQMLTQPEETTKIMTPIRTDDTVYKLAKGVVTSLLQPFQKTYTAKGAVTFTPNPIYLQHMKMDFDEDPDDIEATWLGFLASESLSRAEWPLIRYELESYLFPKLREDFELYAAFKGIQKNPTVGEAGNPQDVIDGIQKLLQDGVAAGTINQVTGLGPLDADTIFDQVEEFVSKISEIYQNVPMDVCMSATWRKAYLKDKRAQGFYQIPGPGQIDESIDFTPQRVKALPSMTGSNILWATPKANMLHITKKSINKNRVKIEESKRSVSIMTDWWEGIGFGINQVVWTTASAASSS